MHFNGDTITVVLDINCNYIRNYRYRDRNVLDGLLGGILLRANQSVARIYQNLIEDLVIARIKRYLAVSHLPCGCVKDPTNLFVSFRATDISIG